MKHKKLLQIALPVALVVFTALIVALIMKNPPQAQHGKPAAAAKIPVHTQVIERAPFNVTIDSYGTVRPRTETVLSAQVSGQIIDVNDNFREGGFFKKGDILIKLDARDYRAKVKVAEADLILAKQTLSEEAAHAAQARDDWARLGKKGKPNDLVLRIPQLEAAKASVLSAQAQLDIARLDLERTEIKAPFDGRILTKYVDMGQVVASNAQLADIYATDYVEVRLPIKNKDLPLIDLPTENAQNDNTNGPTPVLLYSDLIGSQQWQGNLVRTEGAIDSDTQQLYAIAQIESPFSQQGPLIKIGQYVTASIIGVTLPDAIKIPTSTIYQGSFVYIEKDGLINRRDIKILWQNQEDALITAGLEPGENLVLTPLGNVTSGTAVKVIQSSDTAEGKQT